MKLRTKVAAAVAAGLLALGLGMPSPATAAWGSTVKVLQSSGGIAVRNMNGNYFTLGPYGSLQNVAAVWIPRNGCLVLGGYVYCGGANGYWQGIWQVKTYYATTNYA